MKVKMFSSLFFTHEKNILELRKKDQQKKKKFSRETFFDGE